MTITRKALMWSLETLESNTILGNTREPVTENMFSDPSSQAAHTTFLSRKTKNIQCDISVQWHFKGTTGIAFKLKAHCPILTCIFFFSVCYSCIIFELLNTLKSGKGAVIWKFMINFFYLKKKNWGKKSIFNLYTLKHLYLSLSISISKTCRAYLDPATVRMGVFRTCSQRTRPSWTHLILFRVWTPMLMLFSTSTDKELSFPPTC